MPATLTVRTYMFQVLRTTRLSITAWDGWRTFQQYETTRVPACGQFRT